MMPARAWVRLPSRRRLNLLDPTPNDWADSDLAVGLSRTYRWGGHSIWEHPLSVAQHSLLTMTLREQIAGRPLTRIEALQEVLHDGSEGLLGFDPISPVKPHLGRSFNELDQRLQGAIEQRYGLPAWNTDDFPLHKRADRLAAASEALHVAGWTVEEIADTLMIADLPLMADPMPSPLGLRPWEPWPSKLAAGIFFAKLRELVTGSPNGLSEGDITGAVEREATHRHLAEAFMRLGERDRLACSSPPTGSCLTDTLVLAEAGNWSDSVEGVVVDGKQDEAGEWSFDADFKIFTTDEELLVCHGYNCHVERL